MTKGNWTHGLERLQDMVHPEGTILATSSKAETRKKRAEQRGFALALYAMAQGENIPPEFKYFKENVRFLCTTCLYLAIFGSVRER